MLIAKLFILSVALCGSVVSFAFIADKYDGARKVVLRPQLLAVDKFSKSMSPGISIKRDGLSGAARLITIIPQREGVMRTRLERAYQHEMRRYVNDNRLLLGVSYRDLRPVADATLNNDDVAFFKYRVFRDDVRVEDAALLFRFKRGLLVQVLNYSFAEAQPLHTSPPLSDRELRGILARELGANEYVAVGSTWRVAVRDDAYVLIRVRHFRQKFGRQASVQINAHTGKIYEVAPRRYYFAAQGYARAALYQRWYREELNLFPLRGMQIELVDVAGSVFDNAYTDDAGRYDVLRGLLPRINGMVGTRVKVVSADGLHAGVAGTHAGNSWLTFIGRQLQTRVSDDKVIAQSMAYYHLHEVAKTAANYITSAWLDRPLVANTNIGRSCNAHWDSYEGTVNFYSGSDSCANSALIADIIYHEWGHGLDANTGGIVDGAFSEGFGDIISMLMTRSPIIGPDFGLQGRAVRDLEPDRIYPRDVKGGVHETGRIIGSTFWDLFKEFRTHYTEAEALIMLRRYALQMVFTVERYTDVYDALLVIDDDDSDLSDGTPNFCLINTTFAAHGLAPLEAEKCPAAAAAH